MLPATRGFELPVPPHSFFDTEQFWRETYRNKATPLSLEEYRAAFGWSDRVGHWLRHMASLTAADLHRDSAVVALLIGGKGRVLGVPYTKMLGEIIGPERILVQGADGAVNLCGELIVSVPHLKPVSDDQDLDVDVKRERLGQLLANELANADSVLSAVQRYFDASVHQAVRLALAQGRTTIDYLLVDDQVATGITHFIAKTLLRQAIATVQDGWSALSIHVHNNMELSPSWEHCPGHFIRQLVAAALPTSTLIACLELAGVTFAPGEPSDLRGRKLRAKLAGAGLPPEEASAVADWVSDVQAITGDYVQRGGYTIVDEAGRFLAVQRPAPGHVLRFTCDHRGRSMVPLEVDTGNAVRQFNADLEVLLWGGEKQQTSSD